MIALRFLDGHPLAATCMPLDDDGLEKVSMRQGHMLAFKINSLRDITLRFSGTFPVGWSASYNILMGASCCSKNPDSQYH